MAIETPGGLIHTSPLKVSDIQVINITTDIPVSVAVEAYRSIPLCSFSKQYSEYQREFIDSMPLKANRNDSLFASVRISATSPFVDITGF